MPALRITAHQRGGYSAYGPGFYDPKNDQVIRSPGLPPPLRHGEMATAEGSDIVTL